jgi:hypothetical protein
MVELEVKPYEFPGLFTSYDAFAATWQKRFLIAQKIQLTSLIVAAIGGSLSWKYHDHQYGALITIFALLIAGAVRFYLAKYTPERKWYNGRAGAESIKTLSYKYTQCAIPFPGSLPKLEADDVFIERLQKVINTLPSLDSPAGAGGKQITDEMRELRSSSLSVRKAHYIKLRIEDQLEWYTNKSKFNETRSNIWGLVIISLEVIAVILSVFRFSGSFDFDSAGIIAAAAGAAVAWLQSKQHESLSQSYAVTSQELAAVNSLVSEAATESVWSSRVEQSEEAISREHTLWQASHR